jgi:branched-chain amino acid transport system ATP-binding protein
LFDLISGRCAPSAGQIYLNGQRIEGKPPYEINRLGLSRSFQISNIFGQLSVWDNLRCAALWSLGYRYTLFKWLAKLDDVNQHTERLLTLLRLEKKRHTLAAHLTYAEQRALDLGITLGGNASVILLDEPSSGMSRSQAQQFTALIKEATQGKTLLTVEHDMSVLYGLVDKIAVLVQGELLAYDSVELVRGNPAVQLAYLGAACPVASPEVQ